MTPLHALLVGYLGAACLIAFVARRRGRSVMTWLAIGLLVTPVLAAVALWFLPDLQGERERTREFLNQARQRRHRRDPHDAFSRSRDRQEQEIQTKATTVRINRQWLAENVSTTAPTTRILRARENRTPITAIMDSHAQHAAVRRRAHV